jgi:hypothetical protein
LIRLNAFVLLGAIKMQLTASIELPYRGAVMPASNMGPAPAEIPQKKPIVVTHCGPMPQQGSMGGHGHEMHPQKFVQLVGCHVSTEKPKAIHRLH